MSTSTNEVLYMKSKASTKSTTIGPTMDNPYNQSVLSRSFYAPGASIDTPYTVNVGASSLKEFTLYPELPPEIRFKIIQCAIPHFLRILQVKSMRTSCRKYKVVANCINPMLQITRKIRDEVMRYYSAPFKFTSKSLRLVKHLKVNWEIDTLYIRSARDFPPCSTAEFDRLWSDLFGACVPDMKANLRKLAGSADQGFWGTYSKYGLLLPWWKIEGSSLGLSFFNGFNDFASLEEVSIVCGPWSSKNRLIRFDVAPVENGLLYKEDIACFEKGFNHNRGNKKVAVRVYDYIGTLDQRPKEMMKKLGSKYHCSIFNCEQQTFKRHYNILQDR
ncbi:hypothetical protein ONS95_014635 [Cadophora gregata]|uniref:uncharacterized protein n=1 Tax=Cadophora gregata TaxID=51156 RepID=UPI0026DD978E|nr:uncharacterized protein ONS95_014635 [Cadophora gregata]KAK0112914.1 hypothetical protein ONS95_014635 [Cadophora gregata]KAK0125039.1 hypothetical protein ONS96_008907 [Cadophora gregata f. sp. sojae]